MKSTYLNKINAKTCTLLFGTHPMAITTAIYSQTNERLVSLEPRTSTFVLSTFVRPYVGRTKSRPSSQARWKAPSAALESKAKQAKYWVSERPVYFCTTIQQKESSKNTLLHVYKVVNGPCAHDLTHSIQIRQ